MGEGCEKEGDGGGFLISFSWLGFTSFVFFMPVLKLTLQKYALILDTFGSEVGSG